jgi:hypothetical protein
MAVPPCSHNDFRIRMRLFACLYHLTPCVPLESDLTYVHEATKYNKCNHKPEPSAEE